jgi:hypothetical protein
MGLLLQRILGMPCPSLLSFRRKPESRLIRLAWIPARALLGRDDAVGWNIWNDWND